MLEETSILYTFLGRTVRGRTYLSPKLGRRAAYSRRGLNLPQADCSPVARVPQKLP